MNNCLNATGWGELPAMEPTAPEWMSGNYYDHKLWDEHYSTARNAEAYGRVRRMERIDRNHRRSARLCLICLIATVVMLATVGTILG